MRKSATEAFPQTQLVLRSNFLLRTASVVFASSLRDNLRSHKRGKTTIAATWREKKSLHQERQLPSTNCIVVRESRTGGAVENKVAYEGKKSLNTCCASRKESL